MKNTLLKPYAICYVNGKSVRVTPDNYLEISRTIANKDEYDRYFKDYYRQIRKCERDLERIKKEHEKLERETEELRNRLEENLDEEAARLAKNKAERQEKEKQKTLEEIDCLCVDLNHWEIGYENGISPVPDSVFDREFERLENLIDWICANYPDEFKKEDFKWSPTQRLSCSTVNKTKSAFHHKIPMLSIKNALSVDQLGQFLSKKIENLGTSKSLISSSAAVVISPKVDGVSCSIVYKDGKLAHAVTRGNGLVGEDITNHVRAIRNVPLIIRRKGIYEVRGEIYII